MRFFVAALSYIVLSVTGFPLYDIPRRNICSRRSNIVNNERIDADLMGSSLPATISNRNTPTNDDEGLEKWTMEEDWALVDNLPLFTVSSTIETRTFWTQLWSANPIIFSTKGPEDLYKRAIELKKERDLREEQQKVESKKFENDHLIFGASPPVLENWKIDPDAKENMVVGQVTTKDNPGKRTVWFHYHVIGRLQGDPFVDNSSLTASLFPGGFIEAVGGRIYELGQPLSLDEWGKQTNLFGNQKEAIAIDSRRNDKEVSRISQWLLPGSTAAITAFLSSTILSACIGYGAGLSIIHDGSHSHQTTYSTPTVLADPSQSGIKMQQQLSSYPVPAPATRTDISKPNLKTSTEELRAKTQYKVLREEQFLKKIYLQLEADREFLNQLEEQQEQASRLLP